MMKTAYLFDMDGTLVDDMQAHNLAWQQFLAQHGFVRPLAEMRQTIAGKHNADIVAHYWGDRLSEDDVTRLGDAKEAYFRDNFVDHIVPIAGVFDFLQAVKAAGHKLAICTSANRANMEFILDLHAFRPYFDVLLCADDVVKAKPDPEMYWTAAKRLGVEPADCVIFEDSTSGVAAAGNAGMDMVLLTTSLSADIAAAHPHIREAVPDYTALQLERLELL